MIFQGEEMLEENLVAHADDTMGSRSGYFNLSLYWDTTEERADEYLVVCFVSKGSQVYGDVYGETVTLTYGSRELQSISFLDADTELPVNNLELRAGEEDYVYLGFTPMDATTPDRSFTVTSSDPEVVSVDQYAGVISIRGEYCGAATVTVQAAGKSATLYPKVHHTGEIFCTICGGLVFRDVPADAWYYDEVEFAVKQRLMNGVSDQFFEPEEPMTRCQLVTVLWRFEGSPKGATNRFTDVENGIWYAAPVSWAAEQGIVSGVGNGRFDPNGSITREQLVTIFYRYSQMRGLPTHARADLSVFPDQDKVSSWALEAMQWAVSVGLITGNAYSGNVWLDPQGNATRAQVSAIFMRYIEDYVYAEVEPVVAVITDLSGIADASYGEAAYAGVQNYCETNDIRYGYYQPTGDSVEEYVAAVEQAILEEATVVVLPGYMFGAVILEVQDVYPSVKFIALDVLESDLTTDYVTYGSLSSNAVAVTYKEEQAGYLAGYAAVRSGYTQLGFVGGMPVPEVIRYGYGFIQGANAAAEEMAIADIVDIQYVYANQYYGDADITAYCDSLYANGTEIIFACGGGIFTSVAEAAAKWDGKVIGVNVDQAAMIDGTYGEGLTFTSAMKGLSFTTEYLLKEFFENSNWYGGQFLELGAGDGGTAEYGHVMLPTSTQFSDEFTAEDYAARWNLLAEGKVVVSDDVETEPEVAITVFYLGAIK